MTHLRLLFALTLTACLVAAVSMGGNAFAAKGSNASAVKAGKSARGAKKNKVVCRLRVKRGKRLVVCPKRRLRGRRGRRGPNGPSGPSGPSGPAGPTGPAGAPAGSGSGLNLNFSAYLSASEKKEVTIGNFTIRAASNELGACAPIILRAGATDSRLSAGSGESFSLLLNNTLGTVAAAGTSDMFTAVSENGVSSMSGIVGSVTAGGVCLVSGYVTGK